MYGRILVPLDGSATAEQSIPHAAALAKLGDSTLVLLRIIEPFPPVRSMSPADIKAVKSQAIQWAKEYFERITTDLRDQNVDAETVILEGRAGVEIAKYAEENEIDLILLCSRGRTGITRWLMGSVADRVIRGASIPVLLVPSGSDPQNPNN